MLSTPLPSLRDDLYERFLRFADISESSAATYRRALRQLQQFFHERGISSPTRSDMIEYKQSLLKSRKPTTTQTYLSAAKVFFSWLETEQIYPNITRNLKSVSIPPEFKKDYLTADMARMLIDSVHHSRDRAILALMLTCGLRTCEVARCRIGDLRPRGTKTVLYILGKGRTDRDEYCIIPAEVERLIREYIAERGSLPADAPLFASTSNNNRGSAMTSRSISAICKRALELCGFASDRVTAHALRHSAVTLALLNGLSLHEVQLFARHRSLSSTTRYAHELENIENRASERIANSIF